MKDIILNIALNQEINISEVHPFLKNIKFFYDEGHGYCWVAHSKTIYWSYYPMKNSQDVKHFKALKGAKRNFLRTYCKDI